MTLFNGYRPFVSISVYGPSYRAIFDTLCVSARLRHEASDVAACGVN